MRVLTGNQIPLQTHLVTSDEGMRNFPTPETFIGIRAEPAETKPEGGFWTSSLTPGGLCYYRLGTEYSDEPVRSVSAWDAFSAYDPASAHLFTVYANDNARIIEVRTLEDVAELAAMFPATHIRQGAGYEMDDDFNYVRDDDGNKVEIPYYKERPTIDYYAIAKAGYSGIRFDLEEDARKYDYDRACMYGVDVESTVWFAPHFEARYQGVLPAHQDRTRTDLALRAPSERPTSTRLGI
jgi:hypothetical protein